MADFSPSSSSVPPADSFQHESEDITNFLHTLFQNTLPSSPSSLDVSEIKDLLLPPHEDIQHQFSGSAAFSDSSSGVDFPFQSEFYSVEQGEGSLNAYSGAIASSAEETGDFGSESEKDQNAPGVQQNSGPPRSSSKRTRTAEIHNLSEKRRRQNINDKLKALQKLIPNSSRTDKASILDEAIEYLKQLQLQVQTLAVRKGKALHALYKPRMMHSAGPTNMGISFNGAGGLPSSSNRGIVSVPAYQELPTQSVFNASGACAPNREVFVPASLATNNSRCSFAPEPSASRPCNFVMPSKVDASRCGDGSSSGMSSL